MSMSLTLAGLDGRWVAVFDVDFELLHEPNDRPVHTATVNAKILTHDLRDMDMEGIT